MKKIKLNDKDYEILEDYKDGFDMNELSKLSTDYFDEYDYILGDWSYGKLRLKGFCEKNNKIRNELNDFSIVKDYIKNYCAYECKYFIIRKC